MVKQIKMEVSTAIQLSIIIEDKNNNVAELGVQLEDANLIVTTMNVKGKPKAKLSRALFKSLINYAREHYLHIVSFNSYVNRKLQKHTRLYYDVLDQHT